MDYQESVKQVREILADVRYPGSPKSVISLDMVKNIKVDEDGVALKLVFPKKGDPFEKSIVSKCVKALGEAGYSVDISVMYAQDMERPESLENVANIIAISSGKGGVGKSTVSANLAVALAKQGYKVGLVDADIYGPSIPKMFGCEDGRPYMVEVDGKELIEPIEVYGVKILSIGFFVDPASATVWRGPMASGALKQLLEQGHWGELDFLLIDLPPGTSDIHLTLVQTVALTGAVVVSTPQKVALADAIKGINMFESPGISVPVLGLVENMAWFTPEELPENRYYIFGKEGCAELAKERGIQLLGQIPIVQSICDGGDAGRPVATDVNSITGNAFAHLAVNLVNRIEGGVEETHRVRVKK
ncbi:MAG: Mrp/NBP35 family ATP-binding protein [Marinifilaceae bacterium]|nr:Mrp/NBP35 family ATP-binding protein [Marinifilaceae bacterium]